MAQAPFAERPDQALAPALELRVLAGPQAGARCALPLARPWALAAGPRDASPALQADVLLMGSTAPLALRVRPEGRVAVLDLLAGQAMLDGRALATGDSVRWPSGRALRLGEGIEVAWGRADEAVWTPGRDEPETLPPPVAAAAGAGLERWLALAGAALALGSAVLWGLTQALAPQRPAGPSHAAAAAAAAAAAPDLASAVAEVFRLHGLRVQARVVQAGQVEVQLAVAKGSAQQAAQQAALRDVPGLRQLTVQAGPAPSAHAALPDDPGKRITAVVADADLPYLVTADGSRYFVGALLPSGHRVSLIADRQVTIERDGQLTQLAL